MSNLRMVSAYSTDHEARKCGTDVPHEPTDEFVRQAFANGAGSLWPDGRDPGWLVTFDRWLEAREAAARREALLEARDYLSEQEQFDAADLVRTMITTEEQA